MTGDELKSSPFAGVGGTEATSVTAQAKSSHTADPFLVDFRGQSFDPVDYINARLAPLQTGGASTKPAVGLSELSSQAQALASQLNAHTTRLIDKLGQLTDEIQKGRSRSAYEIELFRGEVRALIEVLTEGLKNDMQVLVPGGLRLPVDRQPIKQLSSDGEVTQGPGDVGALELQDAPPYLRQLHMLTIVRSRLDEVMEIFHKAIALPFPPSELSISSSFLSVSAPEPGSSERQSLEERGQLALQRLRHEVDQMLADADDPIGGIERAAQRVDGLKRLLVVWKGTAEEKGRAKFVESLAKTVADRHRDLVKSLEQSAASSRRSEDGVRTGIATVARSRKGSGTADGVGAESGKGFTSAYGILNQLQKIRESM